MRKLNIIICALFFASTLFFTTQVHAAHLIGGEVTYECLGFTGGDPASNSRSYEFSINVFRDCASGGSQFDSPNFIVNMHVTIYHGDDLYDILFLDGPIVEQIDLNPGNPCLIVPPGICVEQGTYVFQIDLPISSESYQMVYQRCCRNNTISNIFNPQDAGSTYTIEVTPEAQQTCNSSPSFTSYPPAVLCAGQNFEYDFSAVDADGDVLIYEFCSPIIGGGNTGNMNTDPDGISPSPDLPPPYSSVSFIAPPYTASNPLGETSNLTLDVNTGIMTGMPANTGQFVVGVCVSEYRNGVLMSRVRRDFQFNVTNCVNTIFADVSEDSIQASTNQYIISSCEDTFVEIDNLSGDINFITSYEWMFDVDNTMVTGSDRDFSHDFPGIGTYYGHMVVNPGSSTCTDTAEVIVNIFPGLDADFSFAYDTCVSNPVLFTNLSTTNEGQSLSSTSWDFDDTGSSFDSSPEHQYQSPGAFDVRLNIVDENGCMATQVKPVSYFPVPDVIVIAPSSFRGCIPEEIFFENLSFPIDDTYTFEWDFGDGGAGEALSPSYLYETAGIYDVSLNIISPIGCETDTVFESLIEMEPRPIADFQLSSDFVTNFDPEINITDGAIGAYRWFYDLNGEATSLNPSPMYVFQDTGLAYVTQVVTHPSGCVDSLTQYIDVRPEITFFFPNAFTPNGDGTNDIFRPKGFTRGFKRYEMRIWNRWGEPVFESADPLIGWNGRKNSVGRDQAPGVFLYEAILIGPRGQEYNYHGYVTLIR